jgi:hypothetical protein
MTSNLVCAESALFPVSIRLDGFPAVVHIERNLVGRGYGVVLGCYLPALSS